MAGKGVNNKTTCVLYRFVSVQHFLCYGIFLCEFWQRFCKFSCDVSVSDWHNSPCILNRPEFSIF